MGANQERALTSVKGSLLRHPAVVGAGGASLAALLGFNIAVFVRGLEADSVRGALGSWRSSS